MLNVYPPTFRVPDTLLTHGLSQEEYQVLAMQLNQMLINLDEGLEKNQVVEYFADLAIHFQCGLLGIDENSLEKNALSPNQYLLSFGPSPCLYFNVQHPENRGQMVTSRSLNRQSYYEMILQVLTGLLASDKGVNLDHIPQYYLISNVYEWYVFSRECLFSLFRRQQSLLEFFQGYQTGKPENRSTESLYRLIDQVSEHHSIDAVYFSLYGLKKGLNKSWEGLTEKLLPIGLFLQHIGKKAETGRQKSYLLEDELAHLLGLEFVPRADQSFYRLHRKLSRNIFHKGSRQERRLATIYLHRQVLQQYIGNDSLVQLEKQGILNKKERNFLPEEAAMPPYALSGCKDLNLDKEIPPNSYWEKILGQQRFSLHPQIALRDSSYAPLTASVWADIWLSLLGEGAPQANHSPAFIGKRIEEQLHKLVLGIFNRQRGWDCREWEELCVKAKDLPVLEVRKTLLGIRICDPNAGYGSVLLGVLHELVRVFHDLGCLLDKSGQTLKEVHLKRVGMGLWAYNDQGNLLGYPEESNGDSAGNYERQVHEALFQTKWDILHNCLFGLSATPYQSQISKNLLLLSLVSNRYQYAGKQQFKWVSFAGFSPNIYPGNPLLSIRPLQSNPNEQKLSHLDLVDPRKGKLKKLKNRYSEMQQPLSLWDNPSPQADEYAESAKPSEQDQLLTQIRLLEEQLNDPEDFWREYLNWRELFPFLWDGKGIFQGFDAVFSSPLSIRQEVFQSFNPYLKGRFASYNHQANYYMYIMELGIRLLKSGGSFAYLTPDKWLSVQYAEKFRKWIDEQAIYTHENLQSSTSSPTEKLRHPLWVKGIKKFPVEKL